jgi:predicted TIM-barrel fold metal-dependent hydrolase
LTETGSTEAAAVRALWEPLGIPGIFDVHTHFLEPRIERAVWAVFDSAGDKIGREWPIHYRVSAAERVALLREFGVRHFPTLPYAHKPGIATFLNEWAAQFKRDVPESLWSATFYPEAEAASYVEQALADGVEIFKVHVQVGEFWLDDPLLDPVWAQLASSRTPIVIHAGSGPVGNEHTGPDPLRRILERWPGLSVIVAHLGTPEYQPFFDLAERFENVRLDTTMVFTDFWEPFDQRLLPRVASLKDKILFGSDCPTIPYPYAHAVESITRLGLDTAWQRAVLWENGARLFGVDASVSEQRERGRTRP